MTSNLRNNKITNNHNNNPNNTNNNNLIKKQLNITDVSHNLSMFIGHNKSRNADNFFKMNNEVSKLNLIEKAAEDKTRNKVNKVGITSTYQQNNFILNTKTKKPEINTNYNITNNKATIQISKIFKKANPISILEKLNKQ